MSQWVDLLNQAHPWVKVKTMYRLKDKYDSILTNYFFGCASKYYFDNVVTSFIDLNKLDGTFMSLCHHLHFLSTQDGHSPEKRQLFHEAFVREFTLRNYVLPDPPPKRRKPEDAILQTIALNPFIDWDRRMGCGPRQYVRSAPSLDQARTQLQKLLYGPQKALNATAYEYLLVMAMQQPGKLLMFLN